MFEKQVQLIHGRFVRGRELLEFPGAEIEGIHISDKTKILEEGRLEGASEEHLGSVDFGVYITEL